MISENSTYQLTIPANILLKGDDIAKILNISRSFAFQLMQRGEIPTVKLGRAVRVRPADLERFILDCISSRIG